MTKDDFKSHIYELVARIPEGRVMSYGQIAALCGQPRAARAVGMIAHFGPEDLPWQRVVNSRGGLASGFWGGRQAHKALLEAEGITVKNYQIDIKKLVWWP